jgi:hypothetical protein
MNFIANIVSMVMGVVAELKALIIALSILSLVFGGVRLTTSGQHGWEKAKGWILYGIGGLLLGLWAESIVAFFQSKSLF